MTDDHDNPFAITVPRGDSNGHAPAPADWEALKGAIIAGLDVGREYEALGVVFTRPAANTKGWRECHAWGRQDADPSAAVNVGTGIYRDLGGEGYKANLFDFALRARPDFGRWIDVVKFYAARAGVEIGRVQARSGGRIKEATYEYRDESGQVRYFVYRYRKPNGSKTFSQHPPDGRGGVKYGEGAMDGVEPLPYRLPELLASDPTTPVWIVEGERCVDSCRGLGLMATTNHEGGGATDRTWPKFLNYFTHRTCLIFPDADPTGRKHAVKVADYLRPVAVSVKLVDPPDRPKGTGLDDWFEMGGDVHALVEIAASTPEWSEEVAGRYCEQLPVDECANRGESPAATYTNGHTEAPFVPNGTTDQGTHHSDEEWEPLRDISLPPTLPFPIDVFPIPLQDLCCTASEILQAPVDYFAVAALGLAGGVIGRSVALRITNTWDVLPNLYLAIVGSPGTKKSPALKLMATPLWEIDAELRRRYQVEKAEYKQARDAGDSAGEAPIPGHLTLDDTTREAFAKVLSQNPRGLVLVKDELTAWVASLNQYRQGKGDDKQFWMSLNTGSLVKVTRKGSDEAIVIPHPCAAVVGCLTPATLPQMVERRVDDGWLDRILFCYPDQDDSPRRWTWQAVAAEALRDWSAAIHWLWDRPLVFEPEKPPRPYFVGLAESARGVWQETYDAHCDETRASDFPTTLIGTWSKLEGYALRFALILSQLRQAFDPEATTVPRDVDALDVLDARKLLNYFKAQVRRARGVLLRYQDGLSVDAAAVLRWIESESLATFTARDVLRHFRRFDDADRDRVIKELIRWRYIRLQAKARQGDHPGRMSLVYAVNPHFLRIDTPV